MVYLIGTIGVLLTIFFVIGTHEFAHFITARLLGVKVLRFSIGFGKTLLRHIDRSGTEYVLALIPLGGYVKMLDENEGDVPTHLKHLAYNRQPYYKKFLIVLAGPLCNLVCALCIYWALFMVGVTTLKPIIGDITPESIAAKAGLTGNLQITEVDGYRTHTWNRVVFQLLYHSGNRDTASIQATNLKSQKTNTYQLDLRTWAMDSLKPQPLKSLGLIPKEPTIPLFVGDFTDDSPAKRAGLLQNDQLLKIDNQAIKNWYAMATFVRDNPGKTVTFTIKRQHKTFQLPITIGTTTHWFSDNTGFIGITPHFTWPKELLQVVKYGPMTALQEAFYETYEFTYLNFVLIGKMLTGKLSFQGLGGPLTIFQYAGSALNSGLVSFLSFLAFLSIAIGVINFIPIPGLDGGHLLIQTIEALIQRPIPDMAIQWLYKMGFLVIILVFFQALLNDILRLF